MTASEYLQHTVVLIWEACERFEAGLRLYANDEDDRGAAVGRAVFAGDRLFAFTIFVDTSETEPQILKYRFHFGAADDSTIFRYDDSMHHPELPTHPHHKHVGPDETVVASEPVSIEQVLGEIREHLRSR